MAATRSEDLDEADVAALEALLRRLADDELVWGERLTEWQVEAPTLESDLAVSNVAQDEFGHARLWYDLLEAFGYDEPDLVWERDPAAFVHASFVELPVAEGAWADTVLRGYLYDVYEWLLLDALADSAYGPLADRVEKVKREETYHREHAESWLEHLCDDEPGRQRVQDALDRLFPYALTLFEPVDEDAEAHIDEAGFRTESLAELRGGWLDEVEPYLESLGLDVPTADLPDQYDVHVPADALPEHVGRGGSHTDDWFDLYDEFTRTYRELGRSHAATFMGTPE